MQKIVAGPFPPEEMRRFLDTFLYREGAFMVDEVLKLDREALAIEALLHTDKPLPYSSMQRTDDHHPPHVAAAELLMATGSLGCMHAWFFHGCRWDEGWAGFGNRIHRADFRALAHLGPPVQLRSTTTRSRVGDKRVMLRLEFEFEQSGRVIYQGDQSAIFVKQRLDF